MFLTHTRKNSNSSYVLNALEQNEKSVGYQQMNTFCEVKLMIFLWKSKFDCIFMSSICFQTLFV